MNFVLTVSLIKPNAAQTVQTPRRMENITVWDDRKNRLSGAADL